MVSDSYKSGKNLLLELRRNQHMNEAKAMEEMKRLKGTQTEKNLAAAFAGESQAHVKYTLFARQAEKDSKMSLIIFIYIYILFVFI